VAYLDFTLTAEEPDNFVLLKNGANFEITIIEVDSEKDVVLHAREWKDKFDIFEFPCPSLSCWNGKSRGLPILPLPGNYKRLKQR